MSKLLLKSLLVSTNFLIWNLLLNVNSSKIGNNIFSSELFNDDEEVKLSHGSQYDEGKKPKFHSLKDIVNSIVPISSVGLSKKNR